MVLFITVLYWSKDESFQVGGRKQAGWRPGRAGEGDFDFLFFRVAGQMNGGATV